MDFQLKNPGSKICLCVEFLTDFVLRRKFALTCILLLLDLCFAGGCHSKPFNHQSESHLRPSTTQRLLASLPFQVCMHCKSIADVHAYEDSLGSKRVMISDGDYLRAFEQRAYSVIWTEDTTFNYSDTAHYNETKIYFELFVRPRANDSIPWAAALYDFGYLYNERAVQIKVLQSDWSRIKFFFHDPVLEPYIYRLFGHESATTFSPDSVFVQAIFDHLTSEIEHQFPMDSKDDVEPSSGYNSDFYDEVGDYIYGNGKYYYGAMVDTFDRPHERDAEISSFIGIRGELKPAPYREMYKYITRDCEQYGFMLSLGWAVTQDYYVRRKVRDGLSYYHFDLHPRDLGIYLNYSRKQ